MLNSLLILTGHSQGLGKAILDVYLKKGNFKVLGISRTSLKLDHPNFSELSIDLSDLDLLESKLSALFPSGDFMNILLINNAGWIGDVKPIGKLEAKKLRDQVNLNLLAPMYLINAFLGVYKANSAKKIICNISSGAASRPVEGWAGYCSTKAGLSMFSQVLAKENDDPSFRVFSLAPGIVDTPMQGEIRKSNEADFPDISKFVSYKEKGDLSSPESVAQKVSYLMDHDSEFQDVIQDVRNF